jgi:siroheme synthase-like protein
MTRLPLALDVRDREVLVVGAGAVAERKVRALLAAGARVRLVAPDASDWLAEQAAAGRLDWAPRGYQAGEIGAAWLVFAATNAPALNRTIAVDAQAARVWCNVAAPRDAGDCQVLASLERGGVTIALATEGASPYAARRLRELVEAAVPEETGRLVALLGELRDEVQARCADEAERRAIWERLWASEALDLLRGGDEPAARAALARCLRP